MRISPVRDSDVTATTSLCLNKCRLLTVYDSKFHEVRHCVGMTREIIQRQVESKKKHDPRCESGLMDILLSLLYSVVG